VRCIDPDLIERKIGVVKKIFTDRCFGFVKLGSTDYFFHIDDLIDQSHWGFVDEGSLLAFRPDPWDIKGKRAKRAAWID
jgi:hypothetical protein